jgi:hypothetical protein
MNLPLHKRNVCTVCLCVCVGGGGGDYATVGVLLHYISEKWGRTRLAPDHLCMISSQ